MNAMETVYPVKLVASYRLEVEEIHTGRGKKRLSTNMPIK